MNTQTQVIADANRHASPMRWAHLIFICCGDQVFAMVEQKDEIGPVWLEVFETFRDAFDFGVQRGFIPAEQLTFSRQELITSEKPVLTSNWIPFKKELVAGLIPGHFVHGH